MRGSAECDKNNNSFKISPESILVLAECLWELVLVKFFMAITEMKNCYGSYMHRAPIWTVRWLCWHKNQWKRPLKTQACMYIWHRHFINHGHNTSTSRLAHIWVYQCSLCLRGEQKARGASPGVPFHRSSPWLTTTALQDTTERTEYISVRRDLQWPSGPTAWPVQGWPS